MFRFSVFSGHTGLSLHDATTSLLDAARLDSGVQTAPAGTDVKVFRQQASKQARKRGQSTYNLICMRDQRFCFLWANTMRPPI
jgi:hypothetical protein